MIQNLFSIILGFVVSTLNIIISPIDLLITTNLSFGLDDLIESINSLINSFINFVPFIIDMTFIPYSIMHFIVSYLVFKYSVKFGAMAVKMCLRWYNVLKG